MIHTPVLLGAFGAFGACPARSSIGCSVSANAATSPDPSGAAAPRPTQRATHAASRIGASSVTGPERVVRSASDQRLTSTRG